MFLCARAGVRARVRADVCACARVCARARACVRLYSLVFPPSPCHQRTPPLSSCPPAHVLPNPPSVPRSPRSLFSFIRPLLSPLPYSLPMPVLRCPDPRPQYLLCQLSFPIFPPSLLLPSSISSTGRCTGEVQEEISTTFADAISAIHTCSDGRVPL